ncbi:MAG: hypothetical protein WC769_06565 [Thermodesulfovibrionales bacterium]|jgi:hypothetical protein
MHTFSRFVYLDTNILSYIAKDSTLWSPLLDYLIGNDFTLGVGTSQIVELADATRLHASLADLFTMVPSALLKTPDQILSEEVSAHPNRRVDSLLSYPLNALFLEKGGPAKIEAFLSSGSLAAGRARQKRLAAAALQRYRELKNNFPLHRSGKYTVSQSASFASAMVIQWLADEYRDFIERFKDDASELHTDTFLSLRAYGLVIYYKYYIGRREPLKPSDFGDLGHSYFLPYCEIVVVERDLANVLFQIKQGTDVLSNTRVETIDFIRSFTIA